MALHYAPVIQSNVLFKYLDGAKDIKPAVVGVDCKFESCELHWVRGDLAFTEAALHESGTLGCRLCGLW